MSANKDPRILAATIEKAMAAAEDEFGKDHNGQLEDYQYVFLWRSLRFCLRNMAKNEDLAGMDMSRFTQFVKGKEAL